MPAPDGTADRTGTPARTARVTVAVHLSETDRQAALAADARAGLTATPKHLPPKWFYDRRGSELFEAITRLPEYYPTRAERAILVAHAGEIAAATGAVTLVELGSGTSAKTALLLDACTSVGTLRRFVPFDVSETTLRDAAAAVAAARPGLVVHAVVGDFEHHLHHLPQADGRLVAFLGGTIGNLPPPARARFLATLAAVLHPGEHLLVGADLVKDPHRLVAAYDDATGVTAEFNRNVLAVLNRRLGARFRPERFAHVARWVPREEWIEMHLRSLVDQEVDVAALGLRVRFCAGEEMRTEISAKFRPGRLEGELAAAGFAPVRRWTDPAGDFALHLARREA